MQYQHTMAKTVQMHVFVETVAQRIHKYWIDFAVTATTGYHELKFLIRTDYNRKAGCWYAAPTTWEYKCWLTGIRERA
jgi:hypothetical protein